MLPPSPPSNEKARLDELTELAILDTLPEPEYDDLAQLAAHICGTPIALVSLLDANRQWFKARVGLDAPETPRNISFCGHAIEDGKLLIVADALADERFSDNPLVTGHPDIRFYAGTPLTTSKGHSLGTLCVIDTTPRELSAEQVTMLEALGRTVTRTLELRKTARDLAGARIMAEAANEAKSRLLTTMSHELRTPLNSIIGFSSLVMNNRDGNLSTSEVSYVERVRANGITLLGLINDLLDLAKVEADQMSLELTSCDICTLAQEVVRTTSTDEGCTLRYVGPAQAPPLMIDERRVRQILTNLVANASRFTEQGAVEVRVQVIDGQVSNIAIADDGPGISADNLERIFLPFEQGSSGDARTHEGTGLGLAITKQLCALHGFHLDAASDIGHGSTFRVGIGEPLPALLHMPPRDRRLRRTVLIVDDQADARAVLSLQLERLGFDILSTNAGDKAILLAQALKPDAAIVDIHMPAMNGWETIQSLRELMPELRILACSSSGHSGPSRIDGVAYANKSEAAESMPQLLEGGHRRVLVVADDPNSRRKAIEALTGEDVEVISASEGEQALAVLRAGGIDLMVHDLRMPDVDGRTIVHTLREEGYTLPVVMWTANDTTGLKGETHAIPKTSETGPLQALLQELLR